MREVQVSCHLPYLLALDSREYPTPAQGGSVHLSRTFSLGLENTAEQTFASMLFNADDDASPDNIDRLQREQADKLLRRVNHLLRWYRATTGQPTIIDLTRAQASPFRFTFKESGARWGDPSTLEYEPSNATLPQAPHAQIVRAVLNGLTSKGDPDVATLNLLDAEYALSVGRFRESVLLSWGAIDSTFVRKFKALVDARLTDEWSEGRDFLKGIDFGLRHKMTTGWRLLTGQSLHAEPDDFWKELSSSYRIRNTVIHEGQIATEDDAKLAIKVARKILKIVASFPAPV